MTKVRSTYHLVGKVNERLILIHLCEKMGAEFKYDPKNQWCVVTAISLKQSQQIRLEFDAIIQFGIRNLVWLQADPRFTNKNIRALNSEFMTGFANGIIANGHPFKNPKTEIERKGLKAGLAYGK